MTKDVPVTPELLLQAYCAGYFPMARSAQGRKLYWFNPDMRGVLLLDEMGAFHVPRSLQKAIRTSPYSITTNTAFSEVIAACATNRREGRDDTWINNHIIALYTELHRMGYAHSVEVWEKPEDEADIISSQQAERRSGTKQTLIGGVYGVSIGGAFFGESMFSTRTNASKIALVYLVRRLQAAGYALLDAQFENAHLIQFGFTGMERKAYLARLRHALSVSPNPSSRFCTVSVSKF